MAKAQLKTTQTAADVGEFLEKIDDVARRADCKTLVKLMSKVSGRPAMMWGASIVGFGKYHYRYKSGREGEFFLIGFSPRKTALTIYIMPGYQDFDEQLTRLGPHKIGKSCLYIKRLSDVDESTLQEMLVEGVRQMREMYDTE